MQAFTVIRKIQVFTELSPRNSVRFAFTLINTSWNDFELDLSGKITDCDNTAIYSFEIESQPLPQMKSICVLEIAKKDIGYYEEDKTKIEVIGTYKDENNNLIKLENSSYFVYPKYLKCN